MSSWKRGFLEIIAEILECLMTNPKKKTHVTFKCNLDSRAVSKYLYLMISVNIVEKSKVDPSYYTITQKGIKYLNHFRSFVSMVEDDLKNIPDSEGQSNQLIASLKMRSR